MQRFVLTGRWAVAVGWIFVASLAAPLTLADGPADNDALAVRPVPPPGIEVPAEQADELRQRCEWIRSQWAECLAAVGDERESARLHDLAAEVLVFPRSVEMALEMNQFYKPNELKIAARLLAEAERRLQVVKQGGDWAAVVLGTAPERRGDSAVQLVVGGYASRIDGSYQPYGLVVPAGFAASDLRPRRLDVWFHGRGETQSEVAFLGKQLSVAGEYTPHDTFVLHPYGRYCNAFRFAGEVDVLEVLEYLTTRLPVDADRVSVRGFSMGGAACWQFATRYADRWFAANPGAGFSETAEFLASFQGEPVRDSAPWYQRQLWNLYDCPPLAINLAHCPTVAYSGEIDRQKQAADLMQVALAEHEIEMVHVIGPNTAHKIHADSKVEIESRMTQLAEAVRPAVPTLVEFRTYTLRHHRMHWVDVQGLGRHWHEANVRAEIDGPLSVQVQTENVTRLKLSFASGQWPQSPRGNIEIKIDGSQVQGPRVLSDRSWNCELIADEGGWRMADEDAVDELRKRPELQGPIDDAFMDSFVFVLPSGQSADPLVQSWVQQEAEHAMRHWRSQYRGDIRAVSDAEVSDELIQSANLILFGDARSNQVIAKIIDRLPLAWDDQTLTVGEQGGESRGRVVAMIYPNPLNPSRYVVLNSGFTFREYDYLNNARQTPKLPDWAIIDISKGATSRAPGVVEAAGFFDERWLPTPRP